MGIRLLALLLTVVALVGMLPAPAYAAETGETAAVDTGDVTVKGTNSFGSLLSKEIQQEQAEDEAADSGGYNVIGLTVENGTATVEYATLEEAVLVVGLYTEDGLQLLNSGKTTVSPDATEAVVTLEGALPEYFMASGRICWIHTTIRPCARPTIPPCIPRTCRICWLLPWRTTRKTAS